MPYMLNRLMERGNRRWQVFEASFVVNSHTKGTANDVAGSCITYCIQHYAYCTSAFSMNQTIFYEPLDRSCEI